MTKARGPEHTAHPPEAVDRPLLVHSPELDRYGFPGGHPMRLGRVAPARDLAAHLGLLDLFDVAAPAEFAEDLPLLVHAADYVASLRDGEAHPEMGIGDAEHPLTEGLEPAAAASVAATVTAAEAVWSGHRRRAVNLSGGMHHAQSRATSGFCVYNDAAAAIRRLLAAGAERVAYLDLDAHHGDGVEREFWDDPRVLTLSTHESGLYLFPGTGFAHDIGGPAAAGTAVNLALPPGTRDLEWLRGVHAIVPQILRVFRPQIIISQHGSDPHRGDPLTHMELSVDALGLAYRSVARWAERYSSGRWVALGGGGYQLDSAARCWVQLLAAVAGVELDPRRTLPAGWTDRLRCSSPGVLGDPGAAEALAEFNPERVRMEGARSAAMVATSRAVFPYWGLPTF